MSKLILKPRNSQFIVCTGQSRDSKSEGASLCLYEQKKKQNITYHMYIKLIAININEYIYIYDLVKKYDF